MVWLKQADCVKQSWTGAGGRINNVAINEFYRTSSTDAGGTQQAWTLSGCDFGVYNIAKSEVKHPLAVR
ncbi:MAG: hypothetical protein V4633_19795 [Pseudomonadota bacterium]